MENAVARGASKCMEKMEKELSPRQKRHYCRTTALNVFSSFCSVASVAFCIFLSISGADIKNRVVDLESAKGEHTFTRAPGYSVEDFNSLIEERVDELLSQVRLAYALGSPALCCWALHLRVNGLWFTQRANEWKMMLFFHLSALLWEFRQDSDSQTNITWMQLPSR